MLDSLNLSSLKNYIKPCPSGGFLVVISLCNIKQQAINILVLKLPTQLLSGTVYTTLLFVSVDGHIVFVIVVVILLGVDSP